LLKEKKTKAKQRKRKEGEKMFAKRFFSHNKQHHRTGARCYCCAGFGFHVSWDPKAENEGVCCISRREVLFFVTASSKSFWDTTAQDMM